MHIPALGVWCLCLFNYRILLYTKFKFICLSCCGMLWFRCFGCFVLLCICVCMCVCFKQSITLKVGGIEHHIESGWYWASHWKWVVYTTFIVMRLSLYIRKVPCSSHIIMSKTQFLPFSQISCPMQPAQDGLVYILCVNKSVEILCNRLGVALLPSIMQPVHNTQHTCTATILNNICMQQFLIKHWGKAKYSTIIMCKSCNLVTINNSSETCPVKIILQLK